MALALNFDKSTNSVVMRITGCHDKHYSNKNGCGELEIITKEFDQKLVSPLGRLFLHTVFGRSYRIQE